MVSKDVSVTGDLSIPLYSPKASGYSFASQADPRRQGFSFKFVMSIESSIDDMVRECLPG